MGKRIRWERIEHAYVTGDLSYKEVSTRYKIPMSTLTEEAKKREWVKKRKQYRDEVAARAIARAMDEEVDRLASVRLAADRMGEVLAEIMQSEEKLKTYAGVLRAESGAEYFEEMRLNTYNNETLRVVGGLLKDLTKTLRNLHNIQTPAEKEAERVVREKLDLERKRVEHEIAKSDDTGDKVVKVVLDDMLKGLDE